MRSISGGRLGLRQVASAELNRRCAALLNEVEQKGETLVVVRYRRAIAVLAPTWSDAVAASRALATDAPATDAPATGAATDDAVAGSAANGSASGSDAEGRTAHDGSLARPLSDEERELWDALDREDRWILGELASISPHAKHQEDLCRGDARVTMRVLGKLEMRGLIERYMDGGWMLITKAGLRLVGALGVPSG